MPRSNWFERGVLGAVLLLVGCAGTGTETGNPTKHGGACRPADISFAITGVDAGVMTNVTVDGDASGCAEDGARARCTLLNSKDQGVDYTWTIAADGYQAQTIPFTADWSEGKCGDGQNVVKVELDVAPR